MASGESDSARLLVAGWSAPPPPSTHLTPSPPLCPLPSLISILRRSSGAPGGMWALSIRLELSLGKLSPEMESYWHVIPRNNTYLHLLLAGHSAISAQVAFYTCEWTLRPNFTVSPFLYVTVISHRHTGSVTASSSHPVHQSLASGCSRDTHTATASDSFVTCLLILLHVFCSQAGNPTLLFRHISVFSPVKNMNEHSENM